MHGSDILLAPLRSRETVISSRMEGTVGALDEVLQREAEQEDDGDPAQRNARGEAVEAYCMAAMRTAQASLKEGAPLSSWLLRLSHRMLLGPGRGAHPSPGAFKSEQNHSADRCAGRSCSSPSIPFFCKRASTGSSPSSTRTAGRS